MDTVSESLYSKLNLKEKNILDKFLLVDHKKEVVDYLNRSSVKNIQIFLTLVSETHRLGFDWYFLYFQDKKDKTFRCAIKEINASDAVKGTVLFDVTIGPKVFACHFYKGRIQNNKKYLKPIELKQARSQRVGIADKRIEELIQWLQKVSEKVQFREAYFPVDYEKREAKAVSSVNRSNEVSSKISPQNVIFYGPPGTGKTRAFEEKIWELEAIHDSKADQKNQTWVEAIIEVLKRHPTGLTVPNLMKESPVKEKGAQVGDKEVFRRILWGVLQSHTVWECENVKTTSRVGDLVFSKSENSVWTLTEDARQKLSLKVNKSEPTDTEKRYEFVTFHQSYSYEDFVEGIRPVLHKKQSSSLSYELKNGIFKEICLRALEDPDNEYVIFIDEINRGNVSKIFGELITLIELDKRKDVYSKQQVWQVRLPYSRELFSVPSNLSIYATMNTADHSLTRIDAALRRRFKFKYFPPDPTVLNTPVFFGDTKVLLSIFLSNINTYLKKCMGDSDHCIGHGYLCDVKSKEELINAIQEKIYPLLQNYFFDEPKKLKQALGDLVSNEGDLDIQALDKEETYRKWPFSSQ